MEERLTAYRKRKQREEFTVKTKETIAGFLRNDLISWATNRRKNTSNVDNIETDQSITSSDTEDEHIEQKVLSDEEIDQVTCCTQKALLKYLFIFVIWATVYAIFIQWQFGYVYFLVSLLVAMYMNTRTEKKAKNEVSAYSVFNKNCTSIHGTVKAEDLERQMIYGQVL